MNKKLQVSFMKAVFVLAIVSLLASLSVFSTQTTASAQSLGTPITPGDLAMLANQIAALPTDQIIIQYKLLSAADAGPDRAGQMQRLSDAAGVSLQYDHAMSGNAHVLRLPEKLPLEQVRAMAARLTALPEVASAEPDRIMYPTLDPLDGASSAAFLTPNDPRYVQQWDLKGTWGINAPAAWDATTGSGSVVVAVIDTGITHHAEFVGRTVPGYDFVYDPRVGNDGSGRDSDPSDPGDWITRTENKGSLFGGFFRGCPIHDSSWHGTHTSGTIAATGNNGLGVAGINWNSKIEMVRVLGKCGGYSSDVLDGMRWAAGLSVPGVPANAHPAKVLSISLGGPGGCDKTYQTGINEIVAAGSVVVVAAGNSAADAGGFSPANCNGVIAVAATGPAGDLTYYSNFGAKVKISAPGGEQSYYNDPHGILSTLNTGSRGPVADTYVNYQGTSMATPHVSGVVSLLFSLYPNLTPAQVLKILQGSATAFPSGGVCNTSKCGAGIVNAGAAIAKATITISGNTGVAGTTLSYVDGVTKAVTADGSGNYSLNVGYGWSGAVTPSESHHTFAPGQKTYANLITDQSGQNYTATQFWYVSGNAGVAGATLSYTDGAAKTVMADGKGDYSLIVSNNYTGTVTVSRAGYTYATDHIDYVSVLSDLTGQNYTPNETVHSISGNVSTSGVTLSFNDGSPQTVISDSGGNYSLLAPDGFAGAITPSKTDATFTPASIDYASTPVTTDLTGQDFAAAVSFTSSGAYDGWVLESSENSNVGGSMNPAGVTFQLGDDASNRQYRLIFSFDTTSLPDNAVITSVVLKVKQSGTPVGANPFNVLGNLFADIRMGTFGATALELTDFQAAASATRVGAFNTIPSAGWYTSTLNAAGIANINKLGPTQFRLYFALDDNNNRVADYIRFISGNAIIDRPTLTISYSVP
ncbi:MAG: S8 family serine peptidase [Anaerolineales bacterium]